MKIFKVKNKNNKHALIIAETEFRAKEIAVLGNHARKIENLTVQDITTSYIENHKHRGFNITSITEGFLFQKIHNNVSTWMSLIPSKNKSLLDL